MRRLLPALLIAFLLFPIAVSAKGGGGGFSSSSGGGRSFSSPSPSFRPSTPSSSSGSFRSSVTPRTPVESQRAGERASHTTIVQQRTTVVNGGGGGMSGSILPWLFLGYYAGGGCNRDRQAERQP